MRSCIVIGALAMCACSGRESSPAPKPTAGDEALDLPGIQLPEVAGPGSIPYVKTVPLLAGSLSAITLDGAPVLALREGAVDPADRGSELGVKIEKLAAALAPRAKQAAPSAIALALDHRLSYRLLFSLLASAKPGFKQPVLLARAGGKTVALPITLPDPRPGVARFAPAPSTDVESDLTPDAVRAKIQSAYMAGIQRCYKDLRKRDPAAMGALRLTLTVDKQGRLQHSSAHGMASICVQKLMGQWVFPIPRDREGQAVEASFVLTLQLTPDGSPPPARDKTEPSEAELAAAAELLKALEQAQPDPARPDPATVATRRAIPLVEEPNNPKLVVTLTRTETVLWSITGMEGTLKAPKLVIPRADAGGAAKLHQALAEIVQRRWGTRARPEYSHEIILMADGDTPLQRLAELWAVVRETSDGKELFRDVLLAAGFE